MTTVFLVFGIIVVLYFLLTWAMFQAICRRFDGKFNPLKIIGEATEEALKPYAEQVNAGMRWAREYPSEDVEITSYDGLTLHGRYYENPNARGIMIGCHGYRSSGCRDFSSACSFYHDHGFSLLLIDERANGKSDGKFITFGIKERLDIQDWCAYIQDRCPDQPILLVGISMGATAVVMAAPELPENVACIVSDCGFVSPWDELSYVLRHYLHLPATPFLRGIDFWCRILAGFSLCQFTTEQALAFNTRPVFFIHGEADDFVPPENVRRNIAACRAPHTVFTVPGAGHGLSYLVDHDGYVKKFYEFLGDCHFPVSSI